MHGDLAHVEPGRQFDCDHPRLTNIEIWKVHMSVYSHLGLKADIATTEVVNYLGYVLCMCKFVESFWRENKTIIMCFANGTY